MEEMRQKLTQSIGWNRKMQNSVRSLLEQADNLKQDIEAILAVTMPGTSLGVPTREHNHKGETKATAPESEANLNNESEVATI
jgi:hypothetical protein